MRTTHYAEREAFCLGCGTTGTSSVPANDYRAPVDAPHPGWCSDPECQEARVAFTETVNHILYRSNDDS